MTVERKYNICPSERNPAVQILIFSFSGFDAFVQNTFPKKGKYGVKMNKVSKFENFLCWPSDDVPTALIFYNNHPRLTYVFCKRTPGVQKT
jgi:hypothetical protein